MNCPKCRGKTYCKDGIVKGRQRYKCKNCSHRYTVDTRSDSKPDEIKRMALIMYLGGLSFREIGEELSIHYSTAKVWVDDIGEKFSLIRAPKKEISIATCDAQIRLLEGKGNKEDKVMIMEIRSTLVFP